MINIELLNDAIYRSRIQKKEIAHRLGISYNGFWKKCSGKSDFKVREILKLQEILRLSKQKRNDIFFGG